jgi:hypothetical protein
MSGINYCVYILIGIRGFLSYNLPAGRMDIDASFSE